jgi:prepilin-type processing-associated H-X9-DG protein
MEQTPVYNQLTSGGNGAFPNWGTAPWTDIAPWDVSISSLRCPDNSWVTNDGWGNIQCCNYCPCVGDVGWALWLWYYNPGTPRGIFGTNWYYASMANITDGTSNTIAFSEMTVYTVPNSIHGDYSGQGFGEVPANCLALKSGTTILGGGVGIQSRRGQWWGGGGLTTPAGFSTVLPPNSIGCSDSVAEWGWDVLMPPDSYHPGGVNGAMADGSVRFISDTINTGNLAATCPYKANFSGQSVFGVWGAMGTMAGGEATSSQ